ncbi:non-ribosomal peptide synthetase [Streptosporangium sp. 'caverna']|uniref:non-ribosomal peptide synthetase n=1 Tax=Streptosporangium sp. 'caverna' TaxID=2202249 RepID=UPI0013A6E322|nr:non-ribosomal peptide synthetase [Streptosporangium sp. 'caverna']
MVQHKLIHRWVEDAVAEDPNAVAVTAGNSALSYGDLNTQAGALAGLLRAHGVAVGSRVVVAVPRSIDFVVAALAVLKAGGAYVPIDPEYPLRRQELMLADSGATLIITAGGQSPEGFPAVDMRTAVKADGASGADSGDETAPDIRPEDLAYIVYTSGSTGIPKGVCISHAAVTDFIGSDRRLAICRGEVVAHLAPTAFDAATFEIWGALARGATVAALSKEEISVAELGGALRTVRPDWMFLTTGLFHLLVDHDVAMFSAVGTVITGGDVLSPQHVRAAAEVVSRDLYAAYGPTETTVFASLHRVDPARSYERVPIGRVLRNKKMYVLDDDLGKLPPGVVGEIYLGGSGLARCYHHRGGATAERFLPDPYSETPGARLYRTGDLGRLLQDGEVEFIGRTDRQVKVRGFRVELGEIEAVLSAHESVGATAVLAVGDDENSKRLVAYLAPAGRAELSAAALRRWVTDALPAYMAPSHYVLLETLPLDPNGKVDRKALPQPWTARADFDLPAMVAPRTDTERLVAQVMADVLELDEVGVEDGFYALGGDSLRSVRMLEHLRGLGITISARDFLYRPTVSALTGLVDEQQLVGDRK